MGRGVNAIVTVAELIAKLQECDPDALVVGPGEDGPALLEGASVKSGWWCPELVSGHIDDFWGDGDRCSTPSGVYEPRPQDGRAVYIKFEHVPPRVRLDYEQLGMKHPPVNLT
jgi:hypothetical protein